MADQPISDDLSGGEFTFSRVEVGPGQGSSQGFQVAS